MVFGGKSDLGSEFFYKMLAAPFELPGDDLDPLGATGPQQFGVGPRRRARRFFAPGKAGFDKGLDQVETPFPVLFFAEAITQRNRLAAVDIVQRDHAVGKLVHGQAEETTGAGRREIHLHAGGGTEGIDENGAAVEARGEAAMQIVSAG